MYKKTEWKDHIVEYPERYIINRNQDKTSTITKAQGQIMQEGTPVNADNLNKIEKGIADNDSAIETLKSSNKTLENEIKQSKSSIKQLDTAIKNKTNKTYICQLMASNWQKISNTEYKYECQQDIEGFTIVLAGLIYNTTSPSEMIKKQSSYNAIYKVASDKGKIIFRATKKPSVDLTIQCTEVGKGMSDNGYIANTNNTLNKMLSGGVLYNGQGTGTSLIDIMQLGPGKTENDGQQLVCDHGNNWKGVSVVCSKEKIHLSEYKTAQIRITINGLYNNNAGTYFGVLPENRKQDLNNLNITGGQIFTSFVRWAEGAYNTTVCTNKVWELDLSNINEEMYLAFRGAIKGAIYDIRLIPKD